MKTDDVIFNPGKSIADLPITDPIHAPCPDMAGMVNPSPAVRKRSLFLLDKLREKHGLKKPAKHHARPMNYVCDPKTGRCIEQWER